MKTTNRVEISISNRTVLRVIGIALAVYLLLRFIDVVAYPLQLILVAAFLAMALNPAVTWLAQKLRLKSRITATGIAYLLVVTVLSLFIASVVPPLVRQTSTFISNAPQTIDNLKTGDSMVSRFIQRNNLEAQIDGLTTNLRERTSELRRPLLDTAGRVGSALVSILIVLVLTFMMLVEGPAWLERYWALQPAARRGHQKKLARGMYRMVTGYVNGQLLLALLGASFAFVTLVVASTLLNVSINALALAGIVLFTNLIPMIGNTLGGVTVVLASLFVSLPLALIMAIFFIVYQQIENISFQPYIQAKYNELTPLSVFIAALLGIGFAGLIGALVAIPVAGGIKIFFQDYLDRHGKRV